MEDTRVSFTIVGSICLFILLLSSQKCIASAQYVNNISAGFQGSQINWIDNNGLFLLSNNSNFAFGFSMTKDFTLFLLAIVYISSSRIVWSANRGSLVRSSDKFVFNNDGNMYLEKGGKKIWSTDTAGKGATAMVLQDSGNLVLLGNDSKPVWQSFSHPTDTLLSNQDFFDGMRLVSNPGSNNLSCYLKIESGDLILYAGFKTPQPYWSMGRDTRKTIDKVGGSVYSATISSNSWRFYDQKQALLWQFTFSSNNDANVTWALVLGSDGLISFYDLGSGGSTSAEPTNIPEDYCSKPEPCGSYYVCNTTKRCQCPEALNSSPNCKPGIVSPCGGSESPIELVNIDNRIDYFALGFVSPVKKTDLNGCKDMCLKNCSCLALFFENRSGNCFLFDQIGSFQRSYQNSIGYISYVKVSANVSRGGQSPGGDGSGNGGIKLHFVVLIAFAGLLAIIGLGYVGYWYYWRKNKLPNPPRDSSEENHLDPPRDSSEEDNFLENIAGMPVRFTYEILETATNNFSVKLGQGGFGSVYQGVLLDGTQIAVKQLEGLGQGEKEFRAEVSMIGSIHHVHLVRLKGFCAESSHRLLVYEYMAKGSLDKWIFKNDKKNLVLNWDTRFNIALGTAKGLAYLHEDCDLKIVHCDIKPENVLLDDNYVAKVSDFGLAKLMSREQSHVFTRLRGTRGYLAPEWITNYAISEKSDVYSFGIVLLEIVGGRKYFDAHENSEKAHFPSYAFKMMKEGKLKEILDSKLKIDGEDEKVFTLIKVALWCIQEDMSSRPSMGRVVQMLEGVFPVPQPSCRIGFHSIFMNGISEEGTLSGPLDTNSHAHLSDVRLSGPR